MEVRFGQPELARLEVDRARDGRHPAGIPTAYRKRINFIRQARDERDLWAFRSWRMEKLKGERSHQYSIRLNDQWRLILELHGKGAPGAPRTVIVVGIEDYH